MPKPYRLYRYDGSSTLIKIGNCDFNTLIDARKMACKAAAVWHEVPRRSTKQYVIVKYFDAVISRIVEFMESNEIIKNG